MAKNHYEYFRRTYLVPCRYNAPVKYQGRPARVVGTSQQYLLLRFDGEKRRSPYIYHPTSDMEWCEQERPSVESRIYEAVHKGRGVRLTADELKSLVNDDAIRTRITVAAATEAGCADAYDGDALGSFSISWKDLKKELLAGLNHD